MLAKGSSAHLDIMKKDWKLSPVLTIMLLPRRSCTSDHSNARDDEEEEDKDLQDGSYILDFCKDSVRHGVNDESNDQADRHCICISMVESRGGGVTYSKLLQAQLRSNTGR